MATAPKKDEGVDSPAIKAASKAPKFVTVASKLPMKIELQLCEERRQNMPGRFGTVEETVHAKVGDSHIINGTAYPRGEPPEGFPDKPEMIKAAGFALTPGIPADFFEQWLDQNKNTDLVRNGMIFAHGSRDHLVGVAMENKDRRSGLDPMAKDGDPRSPRPMNSSVSAIKTENAA